jgi:uncharacterized membrane protein YfcA
MFLSATATFLAYIVKGLCGFANTLVFSSIMSFVWSNSFISPVDLILGFPPNCVLVWKNRKSISWKTCLPLIAIVLTGCFIGSLILKHADVSKLKLVFGIVVVIVAADLLYTEVTQTKRKLSMPVLIITGLLAGVMSGMFGIGALLAAYIGRTSKSDDAFKGTLSAVFLADNLFRFVAYSVEGILTFDIFKKSLVLLPFMFAGLAVGMLIAKKMKARTMKYMVIVALFLSGISLILFTFFAMKN